MGFVAQLSFCGELTASLIQLEVLDGGVLLQSPKGDGRYEE